MKIGEIKTNELIFSTMCVTSNGIMLNGPNYSIMSPVEGLSMDKDGYIIAMNRFGRPCPYEITIHKLRKLSS